MAISRHLIVGGVASGAGQHGTIVDVDPRCEHVVERRANGRTWRATCGKLLVAGSVTRPWHARCPRCREVTRR